MSMKRPWVMTHTATARSRRTKARGRKADEGKLHESTFNEYGGRSERRTSSMPMRLKRKMSSA